jgi:hypothetical protein
MTLMGIRGIHVTYRVDPQNFAKFEEVDSRKIRAISRERFEN